jgi:AhpD family alkylhydroperoxidase
MRLTPLEDPPSLLGRLLDLAIRRTLGRSITPSRVVYNRVPAAWRIALAFQLYERFGAKLPHDLILLLSTRVAMINGCAFCVDIKRATAIRNRLGTRPIRCARGLARPSGLRCPRTGGPRLRRGGDAKQTRLRRDLRRRAPALRRPRDRRADARERDRELLQPAEPAARGRGRRSRGAGAIDLIVC